MNGIQITFAGNVPNAPNGIGGAGMSGIAEVINQGYRVWLGSQPSAVLDRV